MDINSVLLQNPDADISLSIENDSSFVSTNRISIESRNVATIFSCYINLTNTIIGAGMLGLPYAYANTGWVFGTILMLLAAMSSAFALHILSACALKTSGPSSFYSVAATAMPEFTLLIDIAVAIKCFGVATSFLIVIGDLMPDVMDSINASGIWLHRQIWVTIGFAIVAPLSFLKSLDALKYTSVISIGFVVFLVGIIIFYAFDIPSLNPCEDIDDNEVCVGDKSNFIVNIETLRVFSIYVFGFTCHQNVFGVCNEIKNPILPRVNIVILASIGTAFLTYLVIAIAGYSTYGSEVDSDILVSYPTNPLISVARLFVSLHVAFSYPLQANPARRSLMTLVSNFNGKGAPPTDKMIHFRYILITATFLGLSYLIAITISDLGVMLSLVGATGSTIVSYILPGFSYYLTFKEPKFSWTRTFALIQGCIGLILIPLCLTAIFI